MSSPKSLSWSEALAAFRRARAVIVRELGVEPGATLTDAHQTALLGLRHRVASGRLTALKGLLLPPQVEGGLSACRERRFRGTARMISRSGARHSRPAHTAGLLRVSEGVVCGSLRAGVHPNREGLLAAPSPTLHLRPSGSTEHDLSLTTPSRSHASCPDRSLFIPDDVLCGPSRTQHELDAT